MLDWFDSVVAELLVRVPADPAQRTLYLALIIGIAIWTIAFVLWQRRTQKRASEEVNKANPTIAADDSPTAKITELPSLELAAASTRSSQDVEHRRRLIIFIHGLLGSEESTWGEFPTLLIADDRLASEYDVALFGYRTGILALQHVPSLDDVARFLDTEIEAKHTDRSEIVIFAHSMGGLVARRYLADSLARSKKPGGTPCRVSRVLYFATPHRGSALPRLLELTFDVARALAPLLGSTLASVAADAAKRGLSRQLRALSSDSDFFFRLERDEEDVGARDRLTMRYVVAESDIAVDRNSAVGSTDYHIVANTDHWSLVKPADAEHSSVKVARAFLKETGDKTPFSPETDSRQPLLKLVRPGERAAGIDPNKRFVFWNQTLPFVGREDDLAHLEEFLAPQQSPLRWMVLAGPSGIGKSRLALHFCQAAATHWWHAGFADPAEARIHWPTWQPRLPTLMVIDYAGRRADAIGKMLAALADRARPHRLRHPVRVLLVERDNAGPWLNQARLAAYKANDSETRHLDRTLSSLRDDVWQLFLAIPGADRLGRDRTLEALAAIDERRRPLFAHLMADAIARGADIRTWDRTALLKNILEREEYHYWKGPSLAGDGNNTPASPAEKRALVLATMTGGLLPRELDGSHGNLLPAWHADRHPQLFEAMTGADAKRHVPPLLPDIVGEHFVVENLLLQGEERRRLVHLAWELRPERMWWFVSRLGKDHLADVARIGVLAGKRNSSREREFWAQAAINIAVYYCKAERAEEAKEIYRELVKTWTGHSAERRLRLNCEQLYGHLIRNAIDVEPVPETADTLARN